MADFFVVRKSTAEFTSENITYAENQRLICTDIRNGVETDTGYEKMGNGVTPWVDLPYVNTGGSGATYAVYRALLTQTGTDAPVATVLENSLGGTVVWTRDDAGVYDATLASAFTTNKTVASGLNIVSNDDPANNSFMQADILSANVVRFRTIDGGNMNTTSTISA